MTPGSHITEEGVDGLYESIHGLEQVIMGDTTTQLFPEALDRIQIGRVGRQTDQLDLISMFSQPFLHRFGEVDAIVIHDDVLLAGHSLMSEPVEGTIIHGTGRLINPPA